jgi:hypothetical protein
MAQPFQERFQHARGVLNGLCKDTNSLVAECNVNPKSCFCDGSCKTELTRMLRQYLNHLTNYQTQVCRKIQVEMKHCNPENPDESDPDAPYLLKWRQTLSSVLISLVDFLELVYQVTTLLCDDSDLTWCQFRLQLSRYTDEKSNVLGKIWSCLWPTSIPVGLAIGSLAVFGIAASSLLGIMIIVAGTTAGLIACSSKSAAAAIKERHLSKLEDDKLVFFSGFLDASAQLTQFTPLLVENETKRMLKSIETLGLKKKCQARKRHYCSTCFQVDDLQNLVFTDCCKQLSHRKCSCECNTEE